LRTPPFEAGFCISGPRICGLRAERGLANAGGAL
jgi:hypothetical protein